MIIPNRIGNAKRRVANGARWLDEEFPGWEDRINPKTLDLSSGSSCICGQVFENASSSGFVFAHQTLFTEAGGWISRLIHMEAEGENGVPLFGKEAKVRAARVAVALGFEHSISGDYGRRVSYEQLQAEWVKLLKSRIAKRNKQQPRSEPDVVEVAQRIVAGV